jgi:hypothetical protein
MTAKMSTYRTEKDRGYRKINLFSRYKDFFTIKIRGFLCQCLKIHCYGDLQTHVLYMWQTFQKFVMYLNFIWCSSYSSQLQSNINFTEYVSV